MADELSLTVIVDFESATTTALEVVRNLLVDVASDKVHRTTQTVNTSAEDLDLGDLSEDGYCLLKNLDSANFVEVSPNILGTAPLIRIGPGKIALFQLSSNAVAVKVVADTAECELQILAFEA